MSQYLKWVGSKRALAPLILTHFPRTFRRYHEPFCGSAAVFFAQGRRAAAYLNDASPQLMRTHLVVRDEVEALIDILGESSFRYDRALYEHHRSMLNQCGGPDVYLAAAFIFINRCGYNGLWRVNKSGYCNVPFGDYKDPKILDVGALLAASAAMQGAILTCGDYATAARRARSGDLVYFDSPYVPTSETANFTGYTAAGFPASEHHRLSCLFRELVSNGVQCVASNSDTPEVRDLYAGFELHELQRSGTVSSKASKRGKVGELLICGGIQ